LEACVVNVDFFDFQYEEDENNMFNTRTSMDIHKVGYKCGD
jgi:hypothetical protein